MTRAEIDWLYSTWKTKFLGTSSEGLFGPPSVRISHCIQIVRTSCSQLPARSVIFCLLVEAVYWPCGLKFGFSGDNCADKLPAKFCLHNFEWFCLQKIVTQKIFPLLFKAFWLRINNCYYILFSNLKKRTQHYYY